MKTAIIIDIKPSNMVIFYNDKTINNSFNYANPDFLFFFNKLQTK